MILKDPLKGNAIKGIRPFAANRAKGLYDPVLCLTDENGQRFYLSWANLTKILSTVNFDVQQKRIRKHLIPLIDNKPDGQ